MFLDIAFHQCNGKSATISKIFLNSHLAATQLDSNIVQTWLQSWTSVGVTLSLETASSCVFRETPALVIEFTTYTQKDSVYKLVWTFHIFDLSQKPTEPSSSLNS